MADFFRGDVHQEILAARIGLAETLREIPHRCGQFALRTSELLEHQGRQGGIGFFDPNRVHQLFVVKKHLRVSLGLAMTCLNGRVVISSAAWVCCLPGH